jgi:hypothetical protein
MDIKKMQNLMVTSNSNRQKNLEKSVEKQKSFTFGNKLDCNFYQEHLKSA